MDNIMKSNNNILVLFKIGKLNNDIHEITDKYCNKFNNVIDHYFLYCDPNISNNIELNDNIIRTKIKEDNYDKIINLEMVIKNKKDELSILYQSLHNFIKIYSN